LLVAASNEEDEDGEYRELEMLEHGPLAEKS